MYRQAEMKHTLDFDKIRGRSPKLLLTIHTDWHRKHYREMDSPVHRGPEWRHGCTRLNRTKHLTSTMTRCLSQFLRDHHCQRSCYPSQLYTDTMINSIERHRSSDIVVRPIMEYNIRLDARLCMAHRRLKCRTVEVL